MPEPCDTGTPFAPFLQMKKRSPREVKELAQHCSARRAEPGFEPEWPSSYLCALNCDRVSPRDKLPAVCAETTCIPGSEGRWEAAARWGRFTPRAGGVLRSLGTVSGNRQNLKAPEGWHGQIWLPGVDSHGNACIPAEADLRPWPWPRALRAPWWTQSLADARPRQQAALRVHRPDLGTAGLAGPGGRARAFPWEHATGAATCSSH